MSRRGKDSCRNIEYDVQRHIASNGMLGQAGFCSERMKQPAFGDWFSVSVLEVFLSSDNCMHPMLILVLFGDSSPWHTLASP